MRSNGFVCGECDAVAPKWVGRCPACGAWGTLVDAGTKPPASISPVPLTTIDATSDVCHPTGVGELDRVLGGGLVSGSITLLGGEPGIGKSTLMLQALVAMATAGAKVLLICAEESPAQVKLRAARLGTVPDSLLVLPETRMPHIISAIETIRPDVCVVDSIQMVHDPESGSSAGTVAQVRECSQTLALLAKRTRTAVVLVGHVTKDGGLAGPRALEHLVDTVLSFDGDRHHALRMLGALKHRYGPTGELGVWEMTDAGLVAIADPSALLLGDRRRQAPGSAVVITMEGRRPIAAEVQCLAATSPMQTPRRSVQGVDAHRLAQLVAVLSRRCDVDMRLVDLFVSAVGGIRMVEPAADLGIALAVLSAVTDLPIPADLVAFGEIGLGGELRQVVQAERRLGEARRLGFTRAIVPHLSPDSPPGLHLIRASTLADVMRYVVTPAHERERERHPARRSAERPLLTPVS